MLRIHFLPVVIACVLGAAPVQAQFPMMPPMGPMLPLQCAPPGFVPEPCDPPVPVVRLRLRVPACAKPGGNLTYRIQIDNPSPAPAYNVLVRNPLPANCKFVHADPAPEWDHREMVWKLGTLCGGCCREILLVLAPQNAEDVKNCARVQFEHGQCVTTHIAAAPGSKIPGNEPKIPSTGEPPVRPPTQEPKQGGSVIPPPPPIPKKAALTIRMNGPREQNVDTLTEYTITVTNPGTADARKLLVKADIPQKLKFEFASDDGRFFEGQVAWVLEELGAGRSKTFVLQVRSKAEGEFCIVGEALANDSVTDKELEKVRDQVCTRFKGEVGLHIEMIDRIDPLEVGGTTSYPIKVLNQGQVPAINIRVRAFIPAGMNFVRAMGPANYRVQEKRLAEGYQVVDFDVLPVLLGGQEFRYEVFVRTEREGDLRFRAQLISDSLTAGPVTEEESTTVFREDAGPPRPRPGGL